MKQKTQHVMKSTDNSLLLENLVELDDVYWGGKKKVKNVVVEHQAKQMNFFPKIWNLFPKFQIFGNKNSCDNDYIILYSLTT